jgi:signal transduction histidine kinase/ligand-binding sensor domain-containing protein
MQGKQPFQSSYPVLSMRFLVRTAILFVFLLLSSSISRAELLPVKTYTTENGLAHDRIRRIVKDSRGFLWICTAEGLSRFDGYGFVTYNKRHGLPGNGVNDLLETQQGAYWIATDGGVCKLNSSVPQKVNLTADATAAALDTSTLFTVYNLNATALSNRVTSLCEDRSGRIWAGTGGGVFLLDKSQDESFRLFPFHLSNQSDTSLSVYAIAEDAEGSIWLVTGAGLIRVLPDGRILLYEIYSLALQIDRDGRLWLGSFWELFVVKPLAASEVRTHDRFPWRSLSNQTKEVNKKGGQLRLPTNPGEACRLETDERLADHPFGLARSSLQSFCQTSDGHIWIGQQSVSKGGAGLTEFDGQSFHRYTMHNGLSSDLIICVEEDSAGNLWAGTASNGVMKIARNGFISYKQNDGLSHIHINSIYEDENRRLLVNSDHWFINIFDKESFKPVRANLPEEVRLRGWGGSMTSFRDHLGEWWINLNGKLYRFPKVNRIEQLAHTKPSREYSSQDGLTGDTVLTIFEDSRGDLWMSTAYETRDRLTRWNRATETFLRYTEADGLPSFNSPSTFCEDHSGNIWIGFTAGGLARYANGQFRFFSLKEGTAPPAITSLFLDQAKRLWIGTSTEGVFRVDEPANEQPRFVNYTTKEGLNSHNVRCFTEDNAGQIYIGTSRGVDRLDPQTNSMKSYTIADGLANSFITCAFRDDTGNLWFGTLQGLSRSIPQEDKRQSPPPPVFISKFSIRGGEGYDFNLGETAVTLPALSPSQNQIQIDFFGVSFITGENLRYQYKLASASDEWSAPVNQRTVNYPSLPSGSYQFLVRAISADGTVSDTPASISFTIRSPIWQRWWFLTMAMLALGSLIYAAYSYRLKRLLELERVRTRIATDLHDDIGSNLSLIAMVSEVAKQQAPEENQAIRESLALMSRTSRQSVDAMSDIVWAVNPKRDHLHDLTERMRRFASDTFAAKDIDFEFLHPEEKQNTKLGTEIRKQVYLIFKESVNNIAKHSECTAAAIQLGLHQGELELTICDNGKGFEASHTGNGYGGNGLRSMRERAASLGGKIEVESQQGRGATIKLKIPLRRGQSY